MAESNDSMAPNIAIVKAAGNNCCINPKIDCPSAKLTDGILGTGIPEGNSYKSPIVWMPSIPANRFNPQTTRVTRTIATKEPGIFLEIFGVNIIMNKLTAPISNANQLIFDILPA